jgi:hypothetical protein
MLQRCQGLSCSAWQHASSNAWLHQLPPCHLQRVVTAAQRSATAAASTSSSSSTTQPAGKASYNKKQRLDDYCLQQHPQYSKNLVQSWIAQGKVLVNDKVGEGAMGTAAGQGFEQTNSSSQASSNMPGCWLSTLTVGHSVPAHLIPSARKALRKQRQQRQQHRRSTHV